VLAAAHLAPWRPWLLIGSVIFLAVGFWTAYRPRLRGDAASCPVRAGPAVRAFLWSAAALIIAAAIVPEFLT
jgi:hypothetical protein